MNWDDPSPRAALIKSVGPTEYNRQMKAHLDASVVETVNGFALRPVVTRFGRLFMVGQTGTAFSTIEEARTFAHNGGV